MLQDRKRKIAGIITLSTAALGMASTMSTSAGLFDLFRSKETIEQRQKQEQEGGYRTAEYIYNKLLKKTSNAETGEFLKELVGTSNSYESMVNSKAAGNKWTTEALAINILRNNPKATPENVIQHMMNDIHILDVSLDEQTKERLLKWEQINGYDAMVSVCDKLFGGGNTEKEQKERCDIAKKLIGLLNTQEQTKKAERSGSLENIIRILEKNGIKYEEVKNLMLQEIREKGYKIAESIASKLNEGIETTPNDNSSPESKTPEDSSLSVLKKQKTDFGLAITTLLCNDKGEVCKRIKELQETIQGTKKGSDEFKNSEKQLKQFFENLKTNTDIKVKEEIEQFEKLINQEIEVNKILDQFKKDLEEQKTKEKINVFLESIEKDLDSKDKDIAENSKKALTILHSLGYEKTSTVDKFFSSRFSKGTAGWLTFGTNIAWDAAKFLAIAPLVAVGAAAVTAGVTAGVTAAGIAAIPTAVASGIGIAAAAISGGVVHRVIDTVGTTISHKEDRQLDSWKPSNWDGTFIKGAAKRSVTYAGISVISQSIVLKVVDKIPGVKSIEKIPVVGKIFDFVKGIGTIITTSKIYSTICGGVTAGVSKTLTRFNGLSGSK